MFKAGEYFVVQGNRQWKTGDVLQTQASVGCSHQENKLLPFPWQNPCHEFSQSFCTRAGEAASAVTPQNHVLYLILEDDTYNFHRLPSLHPQHLRQPPALLINLDFSYIPFIHQSRLCCSLKEKIGKLTGQTTPEKVSAEPEIVDKILMFPSGSTKVVLVEHHMPQRILISVAYQCSQLPTSCFILISSLPILTTKIKWFKATSPKVQNLIFSLVPANFGKHMGTVTHVLILTVFVNKTSNTNLTSLIFMLTIKL